jgi:NO-binding membrane sensor protein with MHYT domain
MQMHHFSYGALTPVLAYLTSYVGCLLGLLATTRWRALRGPARFSWLAVAAVAIGGDGIWVMHFVAMLGFSVTGVPIRYNVPVTLVSAMVAIMAVGAGLVIAGTNPRSLGRLVLGGVLAGGAIAAMHYQGMSGMVMGAKVTYNPPLLVLSVLIAVVAATLALWFTLVARGRLAPALIALLMAAAVTGMHYTGMAAMRLDGSMPVHFTGDDASAGMFIAPLVVSVSLVMVVVLIVVMFAGSAEDWARDAEFERRLDRWRLAEEVGYPSRPDATAPRPRR